MNTLGGGELDRDELATVQRNLRARFVGPKRPFGVVEVGFGVATKEGHPEASRGLAVCFYVKNKRTPRDKAARLPDEVRVRVKRDGKFVTLALPTDVVEFRQAKLTGVRISQGQRADFVTTGVVVTWLAGTPQAREWGVVTVGHAFPSGVHPADPILDEVVVKAPGNRPAFKGLVVWVSDEPEYDVALVRVVAADLLSAGIILSDDPPPVPVPQRTLNQLTADAGPGPFGGALGQSLREPSSTGPGFRVRQFFPTLGPGVIQGVTRMDNMIRVEASLGPPDGVFPRGTSGSCWYVAGVPAAIQIAGVPADWLIGYGQALVSGTDLVSANLDKVSTFPVSGFEVVSAF